MGAWLPAPWLFSPVSERLSSLLLAVPPSIEKEDLEEAVKVPEGETAQLRCNVSGTGHTADWRRVKRQLWEEGGPQRSGVPAHCPAVPCRVSLDILDFSLSMPLPQTLFPTHLTAELSLQGPQFGSVHSLSRVGLFETPRTAALQASLSITNSRSLLKVMSVESVMPSNHLILCCPLLLLPSIFPSIRVFSNESALRIRCPKYWSFNFSISPSNEHPGVISFRMDWLDLLAVQGTLKNLLNTTVQKHQFFCAQLSLWSYSHIHTRLLEKP